MKKQKEGNRYFTSDTEKWIVEYNVSTDPVYRAKVFTEHIYYPFYKLAENIIHRFKFYYTDVDNLEDLKHDIVTLLLEEKIMKFNPELGAKAYSYFGTIVKRWLINYNAQNYKKLMNNSSIENIDLIEDTPKIYTDLSKISLGSIIDNWLDDCYKRLEILFPRESERKVADSVLTLFNKRENINVFKKKALYIYVREMTDCETPVITSVINTLKLDYNKFTSKTKDDYEVISF
jgi:hypothetical protein